MLVSETCAKEQLSSQYLRSAIEILEVQHTTQILQSIIPKLVGMDVFTYCAFFEVNISAMIVCTQLVLCSLTFSCSILLVYPLAFTLLL